jgi:hypothetical protein
MTYRGFFLTDDTAEAIRRLEVALNGRGVLHVDAARPADTAWEQIRQSPGPTGVTDPRLSMRGSGREVTLRLSRVKDGPADPGMQAVLWAAAVPLGFTPLARHPVPGQDVFHYYGPWTLMVESLWAEGLGEFAWGSLCCATQLMVGNWHGDRLEERMVQTHLHRVGSPCGPIDGVIGDRTRTALRKVGVGHLPVKKAAEVLANYETKFVEPVSTVAPAHGSVSFPGRSVSVHAYGGARVSTTAEGAKVVLPHGGRVVVSLP